MSTQDIANDLVSLWKAARFSESGEKYWAEDVLSVEAMGGSEETRGLDAVRSKGEWWAGAHDVHGVEVDGPFVNGDQFVVRFKMDVTRKAENQRLTLDEMAVYTIKAGKIAEERFFYGA